MVPDFDHTHGTVAGCLPSPRGDREGPGAVEHPVGQAEDDGEFPKPVAGQSQRAAEA